MAPFAPHPPVEDDRCDLSAFACASSVTKKVAHAVGVPLGARLQSAALVVGLEPARQIAGMRACGIDQGLGLRQRRLGGLQPGAQRQVEERLRARCRLDGLVFASESMLATLELAAQVAGEVGYWQSTVGRIVVRCMRLLLDRCVLVGLW